MEKLSGKKKKTKRKSLRFKLSDYWGKDFFTGLFNQIRKGKKLPYFPYGQDNFLIYLAGSFLIFVLFFILSFKVNFNSRLISAFSPVDYKFTATVGLKGKQVPLEDKVFIYKPVLKNGVFSFPVVSAQSVVVFDLTSQTSLYERLRLFLFYRLR